MCRPRTKLLDRIIRAYEACDDGELCQAIEAAALAVRYREREARRQRYRNGKNISQ